jgi:hypothetical protein
MTVVSLSQQVSSHIWRAQLARKSWNSPRGHDFTNVTAPSDAEETSAAYLENTPRL